MKERYKDPELIKNLSEKRKQWWIDHPEAKIKTSIRTKERMKANPEECNRLANYSKTEGNKKKRSEIAKANWAKRKARN